MKSVVNNIRHQSVRYNKEKRILEAASEVFLKYGFHGTTITLVAKEAGVSKPIIHYYFRSKEHLYLRILKLITDLLAGTSYEISSGSKGFGRVRWFLISEQYNNKNLFEKTLKEISQDGYSERIDLINNWLESPVNMKNYL